MARDHYGALVEDYDTWGLQLKGHCLAHLACHMEIWNERNARILRNKCAPHMVVLENIRKEACLWVIAGAKR
jgi:hypothetical protein